MSKKNTKIAVKGAQITISQHIDSDFINLTDIARYKDPKRTDYIIQNWLRNRNTIEFLGIWEKLNNKNFNPIEFDGFRNKSGLNSFVLTSKQITTSFPRRRESPRLTVFSSQYYRQEVTQ